MSWFSGANPLDELVEKATDSALPSDSADLALNLEICDRIRSKSVTAKDAMRSLKKRISHKNPNVQLLALNLSDLCVKNGGSHFLIEVASREFVDNLVSLLRAPIGINHDVRQRLLELLQAWALAFESRSELSYMMSTYQALRSEGLQFPPEERVAAAFVDTAAPPDWADSDVCMRCRTAFTFRNRKHHCRNCGNVFCGQCSTQTMNLPQLGINEPVRVCDSCHAKRAQSAPTNTVMPQRTMSVPSYQQSAPTRSSRELSNDNEDLDLKRALELSLADSKMAASTQPAQQQVRQTSIPVEDSEDADLKAAIEASLAEATAKSAPPNEAYNYPTLSKSTTAADTYSTQETRTGSASVPTARSVNPLELLPNEQENINLFATLVERLKNDQDGTILRDPKIQELYESISLLRPKLARSLGDTVGKYESLVETHSKLATAVKYYDRMLESRLASTYGRGHRPEQWARPSDPYANSAAGGYYGQGDRHEENLRSPVDQHEGAAYYGNAPSQPRDLYDDHGPSQAAGQRGSSPSQHYMQYSQAPPFQEAVQPKEEVSLIDL